VLEKVSVASSSGFLGVFAIAVLENSGADAVWMHIAHSRAEGSQVEIVSDAEWNAMEKFKRDQAEQKAKQEQPQTNNQTK
jgi:hypothetical protein